MTIMANGEPRDMDRDATLADLAREMGRDPDAAGTAIARNGEIVPRREWHTTALVDGDTVEVLTAVGGG